MEEPLLFRLEHFEKSIVISVKLGKVPVSKCSVSVLSVPPVFPTFLKDPLLVLNSSAAEVVPSYLVFP